MEQEDAQQAAPDECEQRTGEAALDHQPEQEGDSEARQDQWFFQGVYHADAAVLQQVGAIAAAICLADRREEPAHMGVP